jgi:hypothetical protein
MGLCLPLRRQVGPGQELAPGESKAAADFVTVYNFYGLLEESAKSPAGWEFSSEEFGRTPTLNGYPMVLPVDVPNTPNLTWTVTNPVAAGAQIDGFAATTRASAMVQWSVHRTGHAPVACYPTRRHWNAKCRGKDVQTSAHRRTPDAELPCGREVTSLSQAPEVASKADTRHYGNYPARATTNGNEKSPGFSSSRAGWK